MHCSYVWCMPWHMMHDAHCILVCYCYHYFMIVRNCECNYRRYIWWRCSLQWLNGMSISLAPSFAFVIIIYMHIRVRVRIYYYNSWFMIYDHYCYHFWNMLPLLNTNYYYNFILLFYDADADELLLLLLCYYCGSIMCLPFYSYTIVWSNTTMTDGKIATASDKRRGKKTNEIDAKQ